MDIAVVGSNMVDLISYIHRMPSDGETVEAPEFRMGCGGKGANQAVAASRLGAEVVMVTRVGNDVFADTTLDNFRKNGIDTTHVLRTDASSGVAPIFVDPESRNSILIIKGANAQLSPADVEGARQDIATCKLIMLQLEIPLETVYATIELGDVLGIPILLNPAPVAPELDLERIRGIEFFMPNESELELITGMPVDTLDDIGKATDVLLGAGITNIIVTLGSRGAMWAHAEGRKIIKAPVFTPWTRQVLAMPSCPTRPSFATTPATTSRRLFPSLLLPSSVGPMSVNPPSSIASLAAEQLSYRMSRE